MPLKSGNLTSNRLESAPTFTVQKHFHSDRLMHQAKIVFLELLAFCGVFFDAGQHLIFRLYFFNLGEL